MEDNFVPIEDKGFFNYEWYSASPIKSNIMEVSCEQIINDKNKNSQQVKKHYSQKEIEEIAKQIVEKSDIAYKLNRAEKRQAIRNVIKDIKKGKIKLQ